MPKLPRALILFTGLFFTTTFPAHALPAFPGAEGFGSQTSGGRGGRVIYVTNLNNSGAGSLRQAAEMETGPRIVVFKVGGVISLQSEIFIKNPHLTIAGQTAPGNGVVLRGGGIRIATSNIIVRGMKVRPGDRPEGEVTTTRDGFTVSGSGTSGLVQNIIIDHNSFSWSLDELGSVWTTDVSEITFSNNIFAQALDDSIHVDEGHIWPDFGRHSMGFLAGAPDGSTDSSHHITLLKNLFISNNDRNPRISSYNVDIINNIFYNWGTNGATFHRRTGGSYAILLNVYGNHWLRGPSTRCAWNNCGNDAKPIRMDDSLGNAKIWMDDNVDEGRYHGDPNSGSDWDLVWCLNGTTGCYRSGSPVFSPSATLLPTFQAYDYVLANVGANPKNRDAIDDGFIKNVINNNGSIIDCIDSCNESTDRDYPMSNPWSVYPTVSSSITDSDSDGISNSWETSHGLNPNDATDRNNLAPSGYTWIEEYINGFYTTGLDPTPTPITTPGDLDHDGDVDIFDYNLLVGKFGQTDCSINITGSCIIDIFDYNLFVQYFGS